MLRPRFLPRLPPLLPSLPRIPFRPLATLTPTPTPRTTSTPSPSPSPNNLVAALGRTPSGAHLQIRKYPTFETKEAERTYRKEHLAAAYRVFAARGFDEGVAGHISVRDPVWEDCFWLNPLSMHFSQIKVSDLILVDEYGTVVQGSQPINAAAFAIHSAIHRRRPDVHAACHAHSVHGKAWSVFGRPLDMLTQDSVRFYNDHAVYGHFGGVVLASEEGERIADALGPNKAAILQSHGLLTVGSSVDEAAFWFLSLDRSCQVQLLVEAAAANGLQKNIIPDAEAARTYENVGTPEKGWLAFQGYYEEVVARSGGDFLN